MKGARFFYDRESLLTLVFQTIGLKLERGTSLAHETKNDELGHGGLELASSWHGKHIITQTAPSSWSLDPMHHQKKRLGSELITR